MSRPNWTPLRMFDELVGASQFAAQFYGFLPDGRDAVVTEPDGPVLRVTLSDLASEGWPPVSTSIPGQFEFRQATQSVLTRAASFAAPGTIADARAWFADAGLRFPATSKCLKLGNGARLKLGTVGDQVSAVIQQRRRDEDVKDALLRRVGGYAQSS